MTYIQQDALQRLERALAVKDADAVEKNLSHKMLTNDFTPVLIRLLEEDWHRSHRRIAKSLQYLRDPSAVDVLFRTTGREFSYLSREDSEALSRICIWALSTLGRHGREKLELLSDSPVIWAAGFAKERLEKWRTRKMDQSDSPNYRQIRAVYTEDTVRVYQAYSSRIANPAVKTGKFKSPPFLMGRMTWIKPSFLWMMYRSGWATKSGQERVLGIDITREGFEWALEHACLSDFETRTDSSYEEWQEKKARLPVRIQWDPERDISLNELAYRSIQVGLSGEAVRRYVGDWIKAITDLTAFVAHVRDIRGSAPPEDVQSELPDERVYPLPSAIAKSIGATYPSDDG